MRSTQGAFGEGANATCRVRLLGDNVDCCEAGPLCLGIATTASLCRLQLDAEIQQRGSQP
jgi:hypothetical protein